MTLILMARARPVVVHTEIAYAAGLEIVAKDGAQFLLVLSGEGMKGLIQDMQLFLEEHPQIAESRSEPRQ